jgi:AcrR family transcriptional regulator
MSWTRQGGGHERRGYHHGNLREALVEAALQLIAANGPAGFTIAEAARFAGVSPAAPYRHFSDAGALLAEVALRGFERFAEALGRAWNDGRPEPVRAFEALGRAYLAFARQEPAYYAAMFEARIAAEAYPALQAAVDRAFGVLRDASERLIADLPRETRPPALMMAPTRLAGNCLCRLKTCWRPGCFCTSKASVWQARKNLDVPRRGI